MDVQDLSPIDDNNTANWTEGSLRVKDVNDAGRVDEGMICRWYLDWRGDNAAAGTASAYTATSQTKPSAYYDGFQMALTLPVNNAAGAQLNVDSLAAAPILRTDGTPVQENDLVANAPQIFVYMGGSWYALTAPGIGTAGRADIGTAEGNVAALDSFRAIPPEQQGIVAQVIWRASTNVPLTWVAANGQSLAAATYPALYAEIGNVFGGDATNFNVPDLGTKVVVGAGTGYGLGDTGGAATVTLTVNQMPAHSHAGQRYDSGGANTSPFVGGSGGFAQAADVVDSTGGGAAHENMPPYIVLYPLMKAGYPV